MARTLPGAGTEELYNLFVVARAGDSASGDALLRELRPAVQRAILARVHRAISAHAVAEELTQDVLLRVSTALQECHARSGAEFMSWAFTITRHVVIDWRRRRTAQLEHRADGVSVDGVQPDTDFANESVSEVSRILGRLLLDAQVELNLRTQEVIRQRLLYGATWRVAGQAAGTTAGGAKRRWQRAMPRLEEAILRGVREITDHNLRGQVLRRLGREDLIDP